MNKKREQPSCPKRCNLDMVYPSYRFFEKNPEYQRLFPEFKDVPPEELEKTNALYGHAKRVMKAVENAVSALDDAESFSAYLEELGRRHKTRALKPTYLEVSTVNREKWFKSPVNINEANKQAENYVGSTISNTSDSVSSGYPNTEKRVENTTRSVVFLMKFEVFG